MQPPKKSSVRTWLPRQCSSYLALGRFNSLNPRVQHRHEHLGAAHFAGAVVGHAEGIAGVVNEPALVRHVGLPH
jgi:hypothetical protein